MYIYHLQEFWFGAKYFSDLEDHHDFITVDLPLVNIDAQIWLTIVSQGFNIEERVVGLAAAGVKSYRFIDAAGFPQYRELREWQSNVRVERCTEITFRFTVRLAWAKAEGMIYYWAE